MRNVPGATMHENKNSFQSVEYDKENPYRRQYLTARQSKYLNKSKIGKKKKGYRDKHRTLSNPRFANDPITFAKLRKKFQKT